MIQVQCGCGILLQFPADSIGRLAECPQCKLDMRLVAAEGDSDRDWGGDFTARIVISNGPDRVGEQLFLGGEGPIGVGKLESKHIRFTTPLISRNHCKLVQVGDGEWRIVDEASRNGCYVNGHRVQRHDLRHGDVLRVGEYELQFLTHGPAPASASTADAGFDAPPPRPSPPVAAASDAPDELYDLADSAPPPSKPMPSPLLAMSHRKPMGTHDRPLPATPQVNVPMDGPECPSCEQHIPRNGKICTQCGIHVPSGRPLLTTKGLDEDALAIRADTWIRVLSWFIPFGLFPVASEAFGTRKPYATWIITAVTVAVSTVFFISYNMSDGESVALSNLMLHSGDAEHTKQRAEKAARQFQKGLEKPGGDEDLDLTEENLHEFITDLGAMERAALIEQGVGFRWYQLITHAFLHDTSGVVGMVFHLAGNMLFLLVFGTRVNELIGNLKFSILYPVLAAAAAAAHMIATRDGLLHPMLGASGAVMGLAGMYFILFPVHRVHMAIWFRGGWLTRWQCFYKLFRMPGFWLLVMWIAWNDVVPMFLFPSRWDNVAHWAHLGGFLVGAGAALLLLITRLDTARGGDILSYTLGRHAWPLVGKPNAWRAKEEPVSGSHPVPVHS